MSLFKPKTAEFINVLRAYLHVRYIFPGLIMLVSEFPACCMFALHVTVLIKTITISLFFFFFFFFRYYFNIEKVAFTANNDCFSLLMVTEPATTCNLNFVTNVYHSDYLLPSLFP